MWPELLPPPARGRVGEGVARSMDPHPAHFVRRPPPYRGRNKKQRIDETNRPLSRASSASPRVRARAYQNKARTAGRQAAAMLLQFQGSLSAPRFSGDVRPRHRRPLKDLRPQEGSCRSGPPRLVRYPAGGVRLAQHRAIFPPAPRAPQSLVPRSSRSAARVLTDEGCVEFNAGAEGGDCAGIGFIGVIPAQAGIQRSELRVCRPWTPAFAGVTWIA
jgi:hypothetical protein